MHRIALTFILVWLCPLSVPAIGLLTYDVGRVLQPQQVQLGASLSGGHQTWSGAFAGRLGIRQGLEFDLNLGAVVMDQNIGQETQVGGQIALLTQAETANFADISANFRTAILYNSALLALGFDPKILVSRHFQLDRKRSILVGIGAGAAITIFNISGPGDDEHVGVLAMLTIGLDMLDGQGIRIEGSLRDDAMRYGALYSVQF
ncbi:MAG: hypothetical protein VX589_02625 [Myxococcota bacterium]|nr:hypothetical protein [Myxococcota bacterium]